MHEVLICDFVVPLIIKTTATIRLSKEQHFKDLMSMISGFRFHLM